MQTSFKKLPGSLIELEVILDQGEFKKHWDDAYNHALSSVHLKGFRPGTAPKELADAAVDKEKVFNEAANDVVRTSLDEISKKNNWIIIDKPQVEVDEYKMGLKLKAKLTIFPEIRLGNYKKIAKQLFSEFVESVKFIKVEPAEVDKAVDWVRESRKKDGKLPELNDEFAKSLGNFKDVADFRNNVSQGLKMEKEFRERDRVRIKVLDEIIKNSKIDAPDIMVEKTLDQMAGNNIEQRGKLKEKAKENVLANLVLYKIAEEEKIPFEPEKGVDNFKVFEYLEGLSK